METMCYGILLADRIIREDNGKMGIIGVFSQLNFPNLPTVFNGPWAIYVGLANIRGKHTISMNLVHDATTSVVLPISFEVSVPPEAHNAIELNIPCPPVLFNNSGSHTLTINIDGHQVASRIIQVNILSVAGA